MLKFNTHIHKFSVSPLDLSLNKLPIFVISLSTEHLSSLFSNSHNSLSMQIELRIPRSLSELSALLSIVNSLDNRSLPDLVLYNE